MRIRVLGPLEVSDGGKLRQVRAGKQRALLAALVVRAGRPVSVERLVDEVWDGGPPATAVNLIQGYVAALRRALGDRAGELLRTQPPGYQLDLLDGQLDSQRFEDLVEQGRTALAGGDSLAATELLSEGERLWRGQPFADLPSTPALDAEVNRLEQLRLVALEARIDADLDLGRHTQVVPDLQAMTGAHPLRERFWAQLMLALYRCGRHAEALEAYRQLYAVLDDELGVEPSPSVRALHQQILTGDEAVEAPAVSSAPTRRRAIVPRQLPASISHFIGRHDQLAQLDALLDDEHAPVHAVVISAITGTAGVGKTALAIHWAHRAAGDFPDGQLYANLHGFDPVGRPSTTSEVVRGFLEALGATPEGIPVELDGQVALYRTMVAGRRILVVLDNARDPDQVRPLLPGSAGCLALITSRDRLDGLVAAQDARPVQLDLLTAEEACDLLAARLGEKRLATDLDAVDAIIRACARLPLALAIFAARAAVHPDIPLGVLAAELEASSLLPFTGRDASTNLRAVFSWSYEQVTPEARRLFRLLALHPGPDITAAAAASLVGRPVAEVRGLLAELCAAHLMGEHALGRYSSHDLLCLYAAELVNQVDSEEERAVATRRVLDHYLHSAYEASRHLNSELKSISLIPRRSGVEPERVEGVDAAVAWLNRERPVLLAAVHHAEGAGFDTHTWQLAAVLNDFMGRTGHWQEQAAAIEAALSAAQRLGDLAVLARIHRSLASTYVQQERHEQSRHHLEQALELSHRLGDPATLAETHRFAGMVLMRQQRYAESLPLAKSALDYYRKTGDRVGQARSLSALGWGHTRLQQHEQAADYCRAALEMLQEVGDRLGEAHTWDSLGHALQHSGELDEAIRCYSQAIGMHDEHGDRYYWAVTKTHLADAMYLIGEQGAAVEHLRDALTVLEELDHSDADGVRATIVRLTSSHAAT